MSSPSPRHRPGDRTPPVTSYGRDVIRYRVLVAGRVQGVCFRDACRQMALEHGVSGWVRNLADGRVEAVFEGPADEVRQCVEWAHHGPALARVTDVAMQAEEPAGLTAFRVR